MAGFGVQGLCPIHDIPFFGHSRDRDLLPSSWEFFHGGDRAHPWMDSANHGVVRRQDEISPACERLWLTSVLDLALPALMFGSTFLPRSFPIVLPTEFEHKEDAKHLNRIIAATYMLQMAMGVFLIHLMLRRVLKRCKMSMILLGYQMLYFLLFATKIYVMIFTVDFMRKASSDIRALTVEKSFPVFWEGVWFLCFYFVSFFLVRETRKEIDGKE